MLPFLPGVWTSTTTTKTHQRKKSSPSTVTSFGGEVLKLTKLSRSEMGSYLCIASNGVPPSVSKRISLSIHCKYIYFRYHQSLHKQSQHTVYSLLLCLYTQISRQLRFVMHTVEWNVCVRCRFGQVLLCRLNSPLLEWLLRLCFPFYLFFLHTHTHILHLPTGV